MIYRFIILTTLLFTLGACAPVIMNGEVTSDEGSKLGPVEMSAFEHRGLKTYAVKAELPDETVFKGEMKFGEKSVTLFSDDGVSMKCIFEMNDDKSFDAGGTGSCSTSDGQNLKVKF